MSESEFKPKQQIVLESHQLKAVAALQQGMAHMDRYTPQVSDEEPVYIVPNDATFTLHEFAHDDGQLLLGHLRDILSVFTGE